MSKRSNVFLEQMGAFFDKPENEQFKIFLRHCENGDDFEIRYIVQRKTKQFLDLQNEYGVTALMISSAQLHYNIVKRLIEANASVDLSDNYGITALMSVFQPRFELNCDSLHRQRGIIRLLLDANATIGSLANTYFINEYTDCDSLKYVLRECPDLSLCTNHGLQCNALNVAISAKNVKVARLLISLGAPVNNRHESGMPPLHQTVTSAIDGATKIFLVKLLIQCGADTMDVDLDFIFYDGRLIDRDAVNEMKALQKIFQKARKKPLAPVIRPLVPCTSLDRSLRLV